MLGREAETLQLWLSYISIYTSLRTIIENRNNCTQLIQFWQEKIVIKFSTEKVCNSSIVCWMLMFALPYSEVLSLGGEVWRGGGAAPHWEIRHWYQHHAVPLSHQGHCAHTALRHTRDPDSNTDSPSKSLIFTKPIRTVIIHNCTQHNSILTDSDRRVDHDSSSAGRLVICSHIWRPPCLHSTALDNGSDGWQFPSRISVNKDKWERGVTSWVRGISRG